MLFGLAHVLLGLLGLVIDQVQVLKIGFSGTWNDPNRVT